MHGARRFRTRGDGEEALAFVAEVGTQGISEPVRLLLDIARVLQGWETQHGRGRPCCDKAADWVETIVGRISDAVGRVNFL